MAEMKTKEQLQAEWWEDWWREDYTWEGLARKPLQGWVVAEGYLREAESGRIYGQPDPERPAPVQGRDANLQDYWRADPESGRLFSDAELGDQLVAAAGQPVFHRVHLPLTYKDGASTGKSDWVDDVLYALIEPRLFKATGTRWAGENYDRRIVGVDGRAQFEGVVLLNLYIGLFVETDTKSASLKLNCKHAAFLRTLIIRNASFSDDANFKQSGFFGHTSFQESIFEGGADFSNAKLFDHSNFKRVVFSEDVDFSGAIFFNDASFEGAMFAKSGVFSSAIFFGDAGYSGTKFNNTASFSKTKFCLRAVFSSSAFSGWVDFQGAQFLLYSSFASAEFLELALFTRARFTGNAIFDHAKFSGNTAFDHTFFLESEEDKNNTDLVFASFISSEFNSEVSFGDAKFSVHARFWDARFAGRIDFRKATFNQSAWFQGSRFSDRVTLDDVTFEASIRFEAADFYGKANLRRIKWPMNPRQLNPRNWHRAFAQAVFHQNLDLTGSGFRALAAFDGAIFEGSLQLDEVSEQNAKETFDKEREWALAAAEEEDVGTLKERRNARLRELERGCRVLKQAMERSSDKRREQLFYRFELQAVQAQTDLRFGEKTFSRLYALTSDYGASMWQPFAALAFLAMTFALLFYVWSFIVDPAALIADRGAAAAQALDLSWRNVFRPFSALSTDVDYGDSNPLAARLLYNAAGTVDGQGLAVRAVSTLQSLCALVLAFLFALAVRRRFQIS